MAGKHSVRAAAHRAPLLGVLLLGLLSACLSACSSSPEPVPEEVAEADAELSWYEVAFTPDPWKDFTLGNEVPLPRQAEIRTLIERGEYLARGAAACGSCHGADPADPLSPLRGGRLMEDSFGEVQAANITPDTENGIGSWTVGEIIDAMRASIGKDETPLSIDLHKGYRWMSNRDATSIALFLLSQNPTHFEVGRRELGTFQRKNWGLVSRHTQVSGYVPELPKKATHQYGRYLAKNVAGCVRCHTAKPGGIGGRTPYAGTEDQPTDLFSSLGRLAQLMVPEPKETQEKTSDIQAMLSEEGKGEYSDALDSREPSTSDRIQAQANELLDSVLPEEKEEVFPIIGPDIRGTSGSGLELWSEQHIVRYLENGKTPEAKSADATLCPWPYYSRMSLKDRQALARFLKRL